jgi:hypothetical protein
MVSLETSTEGINRKDAKDAKDAKIFYDKNNQETLRLCV